MQKALLVGLLAITLVSCGLEENSISGYPVYKFINLGGINQEEFERNEQIFEETLGDAFEIYSKMHGRMVSAGFDRHTPLQVVLENGHDEVEVYIRDEDYDSLWETNPRELEELGTSHHVQIVFKEIEVEGQSLRLVTSFKAERIAQMPIIRK
ncbi:hypothetical protein ACWPKO_11540 [Coraliomargarita sp. W4R53]